GIQALNAAGALLAYHDRSDGGLLVTLVEMAFAGGLGVEVDLAALPGDPRAVLFSEELGAVLQVRAADLGRVEEALAGRGTVPVVGKPADRIVVRRGSEVLLDEERAALRALWSETTHAMQGLRDDPTCADEEQASRLADSPGLQAVMPFDPAE